jgi:citrate lyase subunit beta/citryl-CoA lyase
MAKQVEVGSRGKDIRSDCWMALELTDSGGIQVSLTSKVDVMFGASIIKSCEDGLRHFGVKNAKLVVEDAGALPFTLMARLETAVKRLHADLKTEWLPEMQPFCTYESTRDRFRRSRLYLPGNEPKFFINAGIHKPDGVILDLEDSVAPSQKDAAKILVRNALRQVNFYGAERMVRINQIPKGLEDLDSVVPHNVHVVLIPKCEGADDVHQVEKRTLDLQKKHGLSSPVLFMPIIESALGAIKSYEIASASKSVIALAVGLEDYTADIGTQRTTEGRESFWMRSQVVNAARAAKVQPIDTVFSDVNDMEGLRQSVLEAKSLGFEGKGCIHPRQIAVVNEAFAPSEAEISRARKIVVAFTEAETRGLGVVALGSKMIDPPVVKRALKTVEMAIATGKLAGNWREEEV